MPLPDFAPPRKHAMLRARNLTRLATSALRGLAAPALVLASALVSTAADLPQAPIPAAEATKHFTLEKGFSATLFAGEPQTSQPIAFTFDDAGRMWVVECMSYPNWNGPRKDRVVILEDTDRDGKADKRTVFFDQGMNLTGIEIGFGGVWLCATPNLLFIPDANHDDKPDGEPIVKLDGWDIKAKHNVFSALRWGPDGWLYGCNGILSNSLVGKPGTPDDKRVKLNCSVWRYHPTRENFEVVMSGTTNPWGVDYDDYGQIFSTNCVIEHLWHAIPGSHQKRMFGQDYTPYTYSLMDTVADHIHWGGGHWTEARGGEKHDSAGGGHAHSGAAIYLSHHFPAEYRNRMFLCNIHGNRVNQDSLVRHGSGYVAKHAPDFLNANDPWFRGVAVQQGPEGGLYVSDWCDTGECHNYDIADQRNGRIYRVLYENKADKISDLSKLSSLELAKLQLSENEWFVRHARRLLQERQLVAPTAPEVIEELTQITLGKHANTKRLRGLWALHAIGADKPELLEKLLSDSDEVVRAWSVRLIGQDPARTEALAGAILKLATSEPTGWVRLELASYLQRISGEARWQLATALAGRAEDAADIRVQQMIWFGLEPLVITDAARSLKLATSTKHSLLQQHIGRRLVDRPSPDQVAQGLDDVLHALVATENAAVREELLNGVLTTFTGLRKMQMPAQWPGVYTRLLAAGNEKLEERSTRLAIIFGDQTAMKRLIDRAKDKSVAADKRIAAIEVLVDAKADGAAEALLGLLTDSDVGAAALRGVGFFSDAKIPVTVLAIYDKLPKEQRGSAISALSNRADFASQMLAAIGDGKIPRADLTAYHVAQLNALNNPAVNEKIQSVWGQVRGSSAERQALVAAFKAKLPSEVLAKADLTHGRAIFRKNCASCHTLFDDGGKIGPELTGSQRTNLDYVLSNVLDPSAVVAKDYQLTLIQTDDGRVLTGIVKAESDLTVSLQTTTQLVQIAKSEIENRSQQQLSMMPEGLLREFSDEDVRDLVGYLSSPKQVPLPMAETTK